MPAHQMLLLGFVSTLNVSSILQSDLILQKLKYFEMTTMANRMFVLVKVSDY